MTDAILDVAIIGAGMAGLSCARRLADAGRQVTMFEKSRGVGGRMATRRAEQTSLDHGAPSFMADDPAFVQQVYAWQQASVVAAWQGRFVATQGEGPCVEMPDACRYVGLPRMSALGRHMLGGLVCHTSHRLTALRFDGQHWHLSFDGQATQTARHVVLALPAPQLVALFAEADRVHQLAASVSMLPCWVLMIQCEQSLGLSFAGCTVDHGPLSWVACNSSKPARQPQEQAAGEACESWVIHASAVWSQAHVHDHPDQVAAALWAAFAALTKQPLTLPSPQRMTAHRWLYARADQPLLLGGDWDVQRSLGLTGDWWLGTQVQDAWLSGQWLALRMLDATAATSVRA
jgi:renalase